MQLAALAAQLPCFAVWKSSRPLSANGGSPHRTLAGWQLLCLNCSPQWAEPLGSLLWLCLGFLLCKAKGTELDLRGEEGVVEVRSVGSGVLGTRGLTQALALLAEGVTAPL